MIQEIAVYQCACAKCNKTWITKRKEVPVRCAKCNCITWNEDGEAPPDVRPTPTITPTDDRQAKLDALRAMIAPIESVASPLIPNVQLESAWKFTSEKPQYDETTGNVYRQQYDTANPKRRRAVQVDENDHEKIID